MRPSRTSRRTSLTRGRRPINVGGGSIGPLFGAITVGTPTYSSETTQFSVPMPVAAVGDELFVFSGHRGYGAIDDSISGFTRVATVVGATASRTSVFRRTVDGTEPANLFVITSGFSSGGRAFGMQTTVLVSGGIGAAAIETATKTGSGTFTTPPVLTSTAPKGGFTWFFQHNARDILTTALPEEILRSNGSPNPNYRQLLNYQDVTADGIDNVSVGDFTLGSSAQVDTIVFAISAP